MQLSEHEIRDIIKLLEQGKSLPDKYRFILFDDKKEVELVWNGKTDEICNIVLPFQTIERIDEPRSEKKESLQKTIFDLDDSGRQLTGWTNKLIWGDNKLILSSLKNGPLRKEIEENGGIKLIYIDPPFDVGADFSMNIEIGDEEFTKQPSVLEEIAYRDTWGKGADSFIAMIYERLSLMKDLLAEDGSIYVHCDWRVNSYMRLIMDEIFGKENFRVEIFSKRNEKNDVTEYVNKIPITNDYILGYSKNKDIKIRNFLISGGTDGYWKTDFTGPNANNNDFMVYGQYCKDIKKGRHWMWKEVDTNVAIQNFKNFIDLQNEEIKSIYNKILEYLPNGLDKITYKNNKNIIDNMNSLFAKYALKYPNINFVWVSPTTGKPCYWKHSSDKSVAGNNWVANNIQAYSNDNDYPTEKHEDLLSFIISHQSNENDIVCDFFCGSGTTLAASEKLNRKWIGADLGKFAIHTTRKRIIRVQRELKKEGKDFRAFEILNLGKYERHHYIGINENLRDKDKEKQIQEKEKSFIDLILKAYKAEKSEGFRTFVGVKNSRMVSIGPINVPVSILYIQEIIKEAIEKKITKVDLLSFEFEMGIQNSIQEAKERGVDLSLKYIPKEVFDKRAIEKNQVVFYDISYIEVKPYIKKNIIQIELTDFSCFYNQDNISQVEENLKNGSNKIILESGQIIKLSKDKAGIITREVLTKKWTDWIDYWSVDFDYESKKEILQKQNENEEWEEYWTGGYIFENEWQSFRTKKNRSLELKTIEKQLKPGKRKIAIKVVDIFGNDTMKVIEVNIN